MYYRKRFVTTSGHVVSFTLAGWEFEDRWKPTHTRHDEVEARLHWRLWVEKVERSLGS